jgi:hypothetical protein
MTDDVKIKRVKNLTFQETKFDKAEQDNMINSVNSILEDKFNQLNLNHNPTNASSKA